MYAINSRGNDGITIHPETMNSSYKLRRTTKCSLQHCAGTQFTTMTTECASQCSLATLVADPRCAKLVEELEIDKCLQKLASSPVEDLQIRSREILDYVHK